ncbi:ATP phosphoribosyltransferase [Hydrogenoanaerobacterium saccharovorans]|uniref:ATP phosphoribosyltransferase n=1 Tax=Hydrogenoanaerobacterium saccharovorans TaxID=474960 RepID=A0A1H7ZE74_9FIRM|nr:ATP phosphoribosyltransferase [Hydrogenoanaerobacterium saccharovorans]RPF48701.1 ATP phosphoribosyltransferase [Hydrogenoanaerobacterium saccharovorans]SEM55809.1 ATP phosphoribosyltransferase/ATP phosphoribosyltransferase regulatory subunit [Hydrogenoanaerobacterium saccharovorans]
MLNIALPKGRLGDQVYEIFSQIGYDCKAIYEDNRKLVFENADNGVRYLLVKPSDVAIYVEHGAADIGVVGKDILLESQPDVYELLNLNIGRCRVAVAGKNDYIEQPDRILRVATKYVNIAKQYYAGINREIEIIKLNGSIELAPILGLADVIVDIVETGSTLKENNLCVFQDIVPISARFIANKSSFKFKNAIIEEMLEKLTALLKEREEANK